MRISAFALMVATSIGVAPAAGTQEDRNAACPSTNSGLPQNLAAWGKPPVPVATAHDIREALMRPLMMQRRVTLTLANTETVKFAHAPTEQMPKQYVYSGIVSVRVPKDGVYAVMISEANWIDVIQNGEPVKSLEMRGRLPCVKYGKKIEFSLKAGDAVVQFFGAPYEMVDVLIAPAQ